MTTFWPFLCFEGFGCPFLAIDIHCFKGAQPQNLPFFINFAHLVLGEGCHLLFLAKWSYFIGSILFPFLLRCQRVPIYLSQIFSFIRKLHVLLLASKSPILFSRFFFAANTAMKGHLLHFLVCVLMFLSFLISLDFGHSLIFGHSYLDKTFVEFIAERNYKLSFLLCFENYWKLGKCWTSCNESCRTKKCLIDLYLCESFLELIHLWPLPPSINFQKIGFEWVWSVLVPSGKGRLLAVGSSYGVEV